MSERAILSGVEIRVGRHRAGKQVVDRDGLLRQIGRDRRALPRAFRVDRGGAAPHLVQVAGDEAAAAPVVAIADREAVAGVVEPGMADEVAAVEHQFQAVVDRVAVVARGGEIVGQRQPERRAGPREVGVLAALAEHQPIERIRGGAGVAHVRRGPGVGGGGAEMRIVDRVRDRGVGLDRAMGDQVELHLVGARCTGGAEQRRGREHTAPVRHDASVRITPPDNLVHRKECRVIPMP